MKKNLCSLVLNNEPFTSPSVISLRNKLFKSSLIVLSTALSLFVFNSNARAQSADPSSVIGRVVCGYQGWFTCTGDGAPINRWTHWSPGTAPQPGIAANPNPNLTFDVYPDVSVYENNSLFATNFGNQGDGQPAKLFSSFHDSVTYKHFSLMAANGIDGVAFQRFIWEVLVDPSFQRNRDTMAVHVQKAAEHFQRQFYLVYDLSGLGNVPAANDQARFDAIKADYTNDIVNNLHLTSSSMYTKQGGKPVVQIWGIGYNHIIGTAAIQLDLINWFKAQGCYVIEGVPTGWRTGTGASNPGWINTYNAADMISPWAVGAYSDATTTDNFKTSFLSPDLTYCNSHSMAYQPVIFPGFSWSNWNGGAQNQIPRNKGQFLWHQATNLRALGITSAEIAMFDEYDEGTAIMNMADGYNEIPTNQYFVTSSADGTYLSSDFYLRLAGKLTRVVKGLDASVANVPIPLSNGPIFFRTSNETNYDPIATISTNSSTNITGGACVTNTEKPHAGLSGLKISGTDNSSSSSSVYFNLFAVNIPVTSNTELSFWMFPLAASGKFVSVDLHFTDGTYLRNSAAVDDAGNGMSPAAGRGTVGTWTKVKCNLGTLLSGKTIDKIMAGYDNNGGTGAFTGYIDDISVNNVSLSVVPVRLASFSATASGNNAVITWQSAQEVNMGQYEVERSTDGIQFSHVQTVLAAGTPHTYTITDQNVALLNRNIDKFFYRLKTIDKDGKTLYSAIKTVSFSRRSNLISDSYPNPFVDEVNLSISNRSGGKAEVVINDALGHEVIRKSIIIHKEDINIIINGLQRLVKGTYFLNLTLADETSVIKIEK